MPKHDAPVNLPGMAATVSRRQNDMSTVVQVRSGTIADRWAGPTLRFVRKTASRDAAAVLGLAAIGLAVGLAAAHFGLVDEYLLFRMARVEAWLHSGGFLPYQLNVGVFDEQRPLFEMVLAGLAITTGLSPLQIAVLPIGGILLPLAGYALSAMLFEDRVTAFLVSVALILNHAFATVNLGTFVYVWSTLILFAFLVVLWKVVSEGKSPALILLLAGLFFLSEAFYQTTSAWMIMMLLSISGLTWWLSRGTRSSTTLVGMGALSLSLLAYFLYFDRTFQTAFLAGLGRHGANSQLLSTINDLISQFAVAFWATPHATVPYAAATPSPLAAVAAIVLQYLLLAIAALVGGLALLRRRLQGRSFRLTPRWVFLGALAVTAAGHTLSYALYGHLSLRVVSLLGGIMAAMLLYSVGLSTRWVRGWAVALTGVSLIGMVAALGSVPAPPSAVAIEGASAFLLAQSTTPVVTADLGLYGRLLLVASTRNRTIQLADLDSCGFEHLITSRPSCGQATLGEYLVVDRQQLSRPLASFDWEAFGPPSSYWAAIASNSAQRVVYDSGGIVIFQRLDP